MTVLRLNPSVDLDAAVATYNARGIVQINDIFEADTAEAIRNMLAGQLSWRLLLTDPNSKPVHYSGEEWARLSSDQQSNILSDVTARAQKNEGYFYLTYPMIEGYIKGWDPGHPIHQISELINSAPFLEVGRRLTGAAITKADAHACQYTPGHFLTRHIDYGQDHERRAAYVLGFTKDWQPDWGGLLLFLKENQDIEQGFLPRFNNLTIFDIDYLHTVTQISSFAGAPRLTITGWFRDDPAARPSA